MKLTDRALDVLVLPAARLYMVLAGQQMGLAPEDAASFGACALDKIGETKILSLGKNGVILSDVFTDDVVSLCQDG
jgi:hypothetical protein